MCVYVCTCVHACEIVSAHQGEGEGLAVPGLGDDGAQLVRQLVDRQLLGHRAHLREGVWGEEKKIRFGILLSDVKSGLKSAFASFGLFGEGFHFV